MSKRTPESGQVKSKTGLFCRPRKSRKVAHGVVLNSASKIAGRASGWPGWPSKTARMILPGCRSQDCSISRRVSGRKWGWSPSAMTRCVREASATARPAAVIIRWNAESVQFPHDRRSGIRRVDDDDFLRPGLAPLGQLVAKHGGSFPRQAQLRRAHSARFACGENGDENGVHLISGGPDNSLSG